MRKIQSLNRQIPSLRALLAFEAAARSRNFTACAEELNLTPGAVSRQITQLEEWLQAKLFHRHHHSVRLTVTGESYYKEVSAALKNLAEASHRIATQKRDEVLRVNALPSFTLRWLIPRLSQFQQQYPDIEVRLSTTRDMLGESTEFDVAIRRAETTPTGLSATPLMKEYFLPVCSTAFREKFNLRDAGDLSDIPLIHMSRNITLWSDWGTVANVALTEKSKDLTFDDWYYIINAAISGLGVAIAPFSLILDELDERKLIAPFGTLKLDTLPYVLLRHRKSQGNKAVNRFSSWITTQAAESVGRHQELVKAPSGKC